MVGIGEEGLGELKVVADCSAVPDLTSIDPERCFITWQLELLTEAPRSSIELIFEWAEGDCELAIEALDAAPAVASVAEAEEVAPAPTTEVQLPATETAPAAAAPAARAAAAPQAASAEVNSIRVAIEKIDELLNTVGEIVITQSMLSQLRLRQQMLHGHALGGSSAFIGLSVCNYLFKLALPGTDPGL